MAHRHPYVDLASLRKNSDQRWENVYSLGSFGPQDYLALCNRMSMDPRCTRSLDTALKLDDLHVAANVFTMRDGPSDEWFFVSSSSAMPQLSDLAVEVGYGVALSRARRIDMVGSRCHQLLSEHSSSITDALRSLPNALNGPGYDLLDPQLRRSQAHYRLVVLGGAIQELKGKYGLSDLLKTLDKASIYPVKTSHDEPAFVVLKQLLD